MRTQTMFIIAVMAAVLLVPVVAKGQDHGVSKPATILNSASDTGSQNQSQSNTASQSQTQSDTAAQKQTAKTDSASTKKQKTPLCKFAVMTGNAFQPYQCWNKCPSYTYKHLANYPQEGSYVCMPCHFVATGNKKKPFECSDKCPKTTKERAVQMPKGGGYFACMNPELPYFYVATDNKFQPFYLVRDCPKGQHAEPTAIPNYDSFACFGD